MMNSLLNGNKRGNGPISRIVENKNDGTTYRTKSNEIAESFNNNFCNIALKQKFNPPETESFETNPYSEYLKNTVNNSIHLTDTDAGKI